MSELVKRVEELSNLPQHLCNMCGRCCRMATFKGGLSYEEILELSQSEVEDISQVEGAKDFLSIFEPYATLEEAQKISPDFVKNVLDYFSGDSNLSGNLSANPSFFRCKYIGEDNKCMIHETRPDLCRAYPVPHARTFYYPGCGYEEQGKKNWKEISEIINFLKEQLEKTKPQD